jgi:hypothetical protein
MKKSFGIIWVIYFLFVYGIGIRQGKELKMAVESRRGLLDWKEKDTRTANRDWGKHSMWEMTPKYLLCFVLMRAVAVWVGFCFGHFGWVSLWNCLIIRKSEGSESQCMEITSNFETVKTREFLWDLFILSSFTCFELLLPPC